jgi:competence protein ComEC
VLLQTQTHDVLFDTGPRQGANDAGMRTLLPNLRALGVRQLESVVVSHADSDHAGGLLSVLNAVPVGTLYSSFSFQEWLRRAVHARVSVSLKKEPTQTRLCKRGQRWVWDGVVFQFLHPEAKLPAKVSGLNQVAPLRSAKGKLSKNAQSCVLHVQGLRHSALLPGDIGIQQEQLLLEQHAAESVESPALPASSESPASPEAPESTQSLKSNSVIPTTVVATGLTADLVVVAHHGSETSSSKRFVQQVKAQHAIAQTGYLNRFGHPHPAIQQRWLDAQTRFWQTDRHGAVVAESLPEGLTVQAYSQLRQRYWHQRRP